jgi:hypothetical protein
VRRGPSTYLALLAGFALAVALGLVFPLIARALTYDTHANGNATYVIPNPLEAGVPQKITMAGGVQGCWTPAAGVQKSVRFSCNTAYTWIMGVSEPDAGSTVAATADMNQDAANQIEQRDMIAPHDTICFYTAAAGTCWPSVVGN